VVVKDEKEETGIRKLLNLGHTFAHAIEIERNHKLKHGEAVIVGLACSLYLSNRLGVLKDSSMVKGLRLLKDLAVFIKINKYNETKILNLMKRDKKSLNEKYKFVIIKDFGKILVDVDAENEDVIWAIKQGINFFNN
jgi:3-dehydroquinate synthetase